ncbi:hypothetical protein JHK84_034217 [Glycine max]|nr:hypothetical protein JHK84_034217 [Glycine max]
MEVVELPLRRGIAFEEVGGEVERLEWSELAHGRELVVMMVQWLLREKEKLSNEEVSATDKGNKGRTETHKEKLSNEEVSATNEGSAENSIKSKYNEVSKFEDKDKEQSIQNSKMKTEGGSENNVKNKDVEDGDLKKSKQTSDSFKKMLKKMGESKSIDECKSMIKQFDLKGDGVNTFGVVVLEIVSGLKAVDFRQPEVLLVNKVDEFEVRKRPLEALAYMGLNGEYNLKELMRLVSLGAACTHSDPKLRPSTIQIVGNPGSHDLKERRNGFGLESSYLVNWRRLRHAAVVA